MALRNRAAVNLQRLRWKSAGVQHDAVLSKLERPCFKYVPNGSERLETDLAVVVTHFNKGNAVLICVKSALSQLEPTDLLVIIDDCSGDSFARAAFELAKKSSHRVLFHRLEENKGAAGAKNFGIKAAGAKTVMILDADDELPPGAVQKAKEMVSEHPDADFFFGHYVLRDTVGGTSTLQTCRELLDDTGDLSPRALALEWTLLGSSIFRSHFFEKFGFFDSQFPRTDDIDLLANAILSGAKGVHIDQLVYIWNRSGSGNNAGIPLREKVHGWIRRHRFYRTFLTPKEYFLVLAKKVWGFARQSLRPLSKPHSKQLPPSK